jgi:hypothetical protein
MICCRSTRTSASSAVHDRNRSRTRLKISLMRSAIRPSVARFCAPRQPDSIYDSDTRWFGDPARRSEQLSWASPTPLQSRLPWSGNHGPSRASGSRLLSKTRYPRADGRCLLAGGNTRNSALRGPLRPAVQRTTFVRFLTDINFFGGNVDPSARRCGDRRGLRERRNCPGVRTNYALR